MQIKMSGSSEISIMGNIKSIEDSLEIKNAVSDLQKKGAKSIHLRIQDSFSMTSTVIGHLMKLVNVDKITISMIVGDDRLYQLLEELSLVHPFNVRLVEKP
jgi:predicted DNA-binding protein with PD1-like motif